ncbi:MAG: type I-F CRISPR-associated protein Csy2 [Colwellia sp.]
MSSYITLSHIQVQSANCVAGITYGFPAITSFLGFVRALSIKLKKSHGITLDGCAVIAHQHQVLTYRPIQIGKDGKKKMLDHHFSQTRNPAYTDVQAKALNSKEHKPPSVIEEGKMHLTVSLLIECQGFSGTDDDKRNLEKHIKNHCFTHRLAGGVITDIKNVIYENIQNDNAFYRCRRRLLPGFILMDRSHYLPEYLSVLQQDNDKAEMLDSWLDFCAIKYKAEAQLEKDKELTSKTKASWNDIKKPKMGYLVPITTGYQAISDVYPAGVVKNTRDNETPFCFTEAIYGIGEWLSPHHLTNLGSAIWRYHYADERYYLCKQEIIGNNDKVEQADDIDELFFEY